MEVALEKHVCKIHNQPTKVENCIRHFPVSILGAFQKIYSPSAEICRTLCRVAVAWRRRRPPPADDFPQVQLALFARLRKILQSHDRCESSPAFCTAATVADCARKPSRLTPRAQARLRDGTKKTASCKNYTLGSGGSSSSLFLLCGWRRLSSEIA